MPGSCRPVGSHRQSGITVDELPDMVFLCLLQGMIEVSQTANCTLYPAKCQSYENEDAHLDRKKCALDGCARHDIRGSKRKDGCAGYATLRQHRTTSTET